MTWTETTLGAIAPFSYGKSLPQSERKSGTVPVYGSGGITGFHNEALIDGPACVIGRKGSVGRTYFANGPSWPIDTTFYTHGSNVIDLDYLYFLLQTLPLQESSDSAVPGLNRDYAHSLNVRIPDKCVQQRIANTLKSLDSKICINSEISSTLETIAQTIFKSWFTDFDPVHAKARGEQPDGMDAETAELFPDSFEESEAGLIPAGWHLSDVGSTLRVLGGSTPSTSQPEYWDGPHQWTTPKDMSALSGLISLSSSRRLTDEGLAKINSGLLDKDSILMSSRAPIGYVAIADSPTAVNQGIIAISPTDSFHPLYLANWVKEAMPEIESRAGGSSFAEIGKASFRTLPFLIPTNAVLKAFREVAEPMLGQLKMLAHQNRTLKGIRDTLLPRLISGELEIPEELWVD